MIMFSTGLYCWIMLFILRPRRILLHCWTGILTGSRTVTGSPTMKIESGRCIHGPILLIHWKIISGMLWMPAASGKTKWDRAVYLVLMVYIFSLGFSLRFLL